MNNDSIKDNIRRIRKSKKYTQEEIANCLGISLTAYRDLECGATNMVNNNIMKLADFLGTSTEELVLGYNPKPVSGKSLQEIKAEYEGRISMFEKRIEDLEKLVLSLEKTIETKDEVISMLRKKNN